ncbi:unnamed protein product [Adineta ricciae]|nr:unnamed protein product [Adineta ricciae]
MKRSLTNRLIVHVACCDLIILLLNLPDLIQFVLSRNGNWLLSEFSCKLIRSLLVFAQYASVLTMCAITIERFFGIVHPLRSKFLGERKHLRYVTFFVWIFSFICVSPNFIYLRVISHSSTHRSCSLLYSQNVPDNQRYYIIHKSLESMIFYFIPLFLQLYCYCRIATKLFYVDQTLQSSLPLNQISNYHRTLEDFDNEIDQEENLTSRITRTDSYVHSSINVKSKHLSPKLFSSLNNSQFSIEKKSNEDKFYQIYSNTLKSRRNIIKMLIVVIVIYFISFSPQVLVFLLFQTNTIRPVPQFIQTSYFIALTMLLITISSASNPIVYAVFCSKFRQRFHNLLRHFCFWK